LPAEAAFLGRCLCPLAEEVLELRDLDHGRLRRVDEVGQRVKEFAGRLGMGKVTGVRDDLELWPPGSMTDRMVRMND